jgi:hypothetical protein
MLCHVECNFCCHSNHIYFENVSTRTVLALPSAEKLRLVAIHLILALTSRNLYLELHCTPTVN